jgi:hypothetical protein
MTLQQRSLSAWQMHRPEPVPGQPARDPFTQPDPDQLPAGTPPANVPGTAIEPDALPPAVNRMRARAPASVQTDNRPIDYRRLQFATQVLLALGYAQRVAHPA